METEWPLFKEIKIVEHNQEEVKFIRVEFPYVQEEEKKEERYCVIDAIQYLVDQSILPVFRIFSFGGTLPKRTNLLLVKGLVFIIQIITIATELIRAGDDSGARFWLLFALVAALHFYLVLFIQNRVVLNILNKGNPEDYDYIIFSMHFLSFLFFSLYFVSHLMLFFTFLNRSQIQNDNKLCASLILHAFSFLVIMSLDQIILLLFATTLGFFLFLLLILLFFVLFSFALLYVIAWLVIIFITCGYINIIKKGKKNSKILLLPIVVYCALDFTTDNCTICLNDFETNERLIQSQCNKNHIFHQACIIEWLKIKRICPICRAHV